MSDHSPLSRALILDNICYITIKNTMERVYGTFPEMYNFLFHYIPFANYIAGEPLETNLDAGMDYMYKTYLLHLREVEEYIGGRM